MLACDNPVVQHCRKPNGDKQGTCAGCPDLPCGSPPPFGERFVQKMVWLMWPPPLNLRAGCSATCVVTSPTIQSQMLAVDTKRVDASNYNCGHDSTYAVKSQSEATGVLEKNVSAIISVVSSFLPFERASWYFSSVTFRLLTYVAWCLLWCSCMISALMCGSRAP